MDALSFQRLDFQLVLDHLRGYAKSSAAREQIKKTRPWTDLETINRHFDGVEELLGLLDRGGRLQIGDFDDCGEILERLAKPHSVLQAESWLQLHRFLHITRQVQKQLRDARETMPACWEQAESLDPVHSLGAEIRRVFDEEGQVRDKASEDLRQCRRKMQQLRKELEKVLQRLLARFSSDVLQDGYVTERAGRRTLPVRAGARSKVPGIVHDTSNSGETLFIEPLDAVEPANQLFAEENREREIIQKIFADLADFGRGFIPMLQTNRAILVQLDLWNARARLANRHNLHRPTLGQDIPLHLMQAHHPLIYFESPEESVPLHIKLEKENRTLVITGPNTGGKTTCLKTIALTALMAQSAIPVAAAADSKLSLFQQVLAEIGDDQSVAEKISTFSGHIRRISEILQDAGEESLVILDELGKATDPLQAGALGRAILEALCEAGALTLVTTHLPTLKDWGHEYPAARNASFKLDARSHRPLYHLEMDTPGLSEAFTIARMEGLPEAIVERARHALPCEEREMAELLETLHQKEADLRLELEKAKQARQKAEKAKLDFQSKRAATDKRKTELDLQLEKEYKELLDKARKDLEKRIANLPSRQALADARRQVQQDQKGAEQRIASLQRQEEKILQSALPPQKDKEISTANWQPMEGEYAALKKTGQTGKIISTDVAKGRAKILVGSLQLDVKTQELEPARPPEEPQDRYSGARYLKGATSAHVKTELDLHGWRVAEALEEADKYLDQAVLSHHPKVRIIHGYGTGALRNALHELFRAHPHIAQYRMGNRDEGGNAVTVIQLKT